MLHTDRPEIVTGYVTTINYVVSKKPASGCAAIPTFP